MQFKAGRYLFDVLCMFFFFGLALNAADSFAGNTYDHGALVGINLPSLRMEWRQGISNPVIWDVNAGIRKDETNWFSMLSVSAGSEPLSRHLCIQGTIGGQPIPEASVVSELKTAKLSDEPFVIVKRGIPKAHLHIEKLFSFTSTPFRFFFTVRLVNPSEKEFVPGTGDNLSLILGPGLGDQRSKGLGYAESMYSFVEPVAMQNDRLLRYRDGMPHMTELPWTGPETHWIGLHGRYFALLLAPALKAGTSLLPFDEVHLGYDEPVGYDFPLDHLPELSMQLPLKKIAAGESLQWDFLVFSGPKSVEALKAGPFDFSEILFPGLWQWMRWLCFGLLGLLVAVHSLVPSWGLAIIFLAVLVRIAMYPIAKKAMARQHEFVDVQKRMQPELNVIKRDFKGGEQSERILRLYEQHGVSPLAGLKPLLIVLLQLPILIALFHVLGSAYELRDASFFWIDTLSGPDKLFPLGFTLPILGDYFNLLPVLMAVSTVLTMKYSPAPAADASAKKRQNVFLLIMAFGFLILFYPFPAGMVLYWTVANLLHLFQQKLL